MAETELTTTRATGLAVAAPDFMQEDKGMGLDLVKTKIKPPFLKIIQKMSATELIDQFGTGAVILSPDGTLILEPKAAPVRVIPLMFYIEFLKLAPIALKGVEPMIAARSLDPKSDLARRCMDRTLWYEEHPNFPGDEKKRYRNAEALTFVLMFQEEHLPTIPFVVSFMKGSYGKGQLFCNQISMRKAPLFGCVFELSVDPTMGRNSQGEWYRFLTSNPADEPFVKSKEEYEALKSLHLDFDQAYRDQNIEAEYNEEDAVEGAGDTGEF